MYLSPLYLTLAWKASYGLCKSRIYSITDINTAVPFLSLLIFFLHYFSILWFEGTIFFLSLTFLKDLGANFILSVFF